MRSLLMFIHIPKTAGTTFKTVIANNFKKKEIFTLYKHRQFKERISELNQILLNERNSKTLLLGHIGYGIHNYIEPMYSVEYITFLRDPIKRVISMYKHILRDKNHQLHQVVKQMSIQEYIVSGIDESAINSQTRFLSESKLNYELLAEDDTSGFLPYGSNQEMLMGARKNLMKFKFVGITEKFNESLVLLKHSNSFRNIYYSRFNKASNNDINISKKDIEIIKEYNQLDVLLYQEALDRHNSLIKSYVNEIEDFKTKNALFGKFYGYNGRIKNVFRK